MFALWLGLCAGGYFVHLRLRFGLLMGGGGDTIVGDFHRVLPVLGVNSLDKFVEFHSACRLGVVDHLIFYMMGQAVICLPTEVTEGSFSPLNLGQQSVKLHEVLHGVVILGHPEYL